jgi:NAD(P)-dependent dehydrogenase (short-subunit alcohol dehydrogenase family)
MSTALFALNDRIAVVTGGLGRLGRAYAEALLAHGAKVAILDQSEEPATVRNALAALADHAALLVCGVDVVRRSTLEDALARISARWGRAPDILINNAAIDSPPDAPASENGPFETYPEESWDRIMAVNVKGVMLCCQVFGGAMARAGGGSIVNVASIYGSVAPDQSIYDYRRQRGETYYKPVAYSASKSALYNLTRYLAVYWAKNRVRVNTLTLAGVFAGQDPAFLDAYTRRIPVGRMAEPADYVGPMLFLVSDASRYMTGADLVVDGGWTAI